MPIMPMDADGMTLALMLAVYAEKAKQSTAEDKTEGHGAANLAVYAFYDAMQRTATAFSQVLDCKRTTREAYERLIDYATRLELQLVELDLEEKEAASDGTGQGSDAR
jgi:hypothetical protein